ncbi:TAXI family TRAP transporter solute-binding subunit [Chloroflexota bacterium]
MRKITIGILVLVLLLATVLTACGGTPAPAPTVTVTKPATAPAPMPTHEMVTVSQWASPFATSTHVLTLGMEDLSKKFHPWLRLKSAETPGYVYNMNAHTSQPALWENTYVGAAAMNIYQGTIRQGPFESAPDRILGYRRLVSHNSQAIWLVSTDPSIKTTDDLVGKKIALGTKAQSNVNAGPSFLLVDGLGLDPAQIQSIGHAGAMDALLDGLVDAAVTFAYSNPLIDEHVAGPTQVKLEASGKTIYHISFPQEAFDNAIAKGLPVPQLTVPAGILKDQNEEIRAFASVNGFYVKDVFSEDLAYEITKFWLEVGAEKLVEYHAFGKLVTPEGLAYAGTKSGLAGSVLHPGAVRAYEEAGITIPDK